MGGANADLAQPIGLVWSQFFGNMAALFSEDLTDLFRELVKDMLDLAGSHEIIQYVVK